MARRRGPARTRGFHLVVLLGVGLGVACSADETASGPIEAHELAERIAAGDAPRILDVRTPEEFASGHLPGAINIPHSELPGRLSELEASPTSEIVVHCERGGRARTTETLLEEAGFTNVRDLSGHMQGWREGGYPVE